MADTIEEFEKELTLVREELRCVKDGYANLQKYLNIVESDKQHGVGELENNDNGYSFYTKLLNIVSDLFDSVKYSDFMFVLKGGDQLHGHKFIITARSNWNGSEFDEMTSFSLEDYSCDVGVGFVKWIYTGQVDIKNGKDYLKQLLEMGKKYSMNQLVKSCEHLLMAPIDGDGNYNKISEDNNDDDNNGDVEDVSAYNVEKLSNQAEGEIIKTTIFQNGNSSERTETIEMKNESMSSIESKTTSLNVTEDLRNKCLICNRKYTTQIKLKRHVKIHKQTMSESEFVSVYPTEDPLDVNVECHICHQKYKSPVKLRRHLKIHERKEMAESRNEDMKFFCDVCNKRFPTELKRNRHKWNHNRKINKTISCDVCHRLFISPGILIQHQQVHTGIKLFKCEICGKEFTSKGHLKAHSLIHKGVKDFNCELCNNNFYSKSALNKHMHSHTNIKKFKCDACGKTFRTFQCLNRHLHQHNNQRPYLCNECGQGFIQLTQLQVHMRIHTGERPYKCDFCQKSFASKYVMQQHVTIHSSERPYVCDICGLTFNHQSNCRRHIQLHIHSKPYQCDVCGKAYSKKESLKNHKHSNAKRHSLPKDINSSQHFQV